MADNPTIRQIPRDKLFAIFKSWELVQLFETILLAVGQTLPENTDGVREALDAHIADTTAAHAASAVSFSPVGGITATNVQSAIQDVSAGAQPISDLLTAIGALTPAADEALYFTGPDAPALTTLTAFARTLLALADAAAARSELALGSIATQDADDVAVTGGDVLLAAGLLGYATGNGGADTQVGSKSAGVTIDAPSGEITMDGEVLAAGDSVVFTLTNDKVAEGDRLILNHQAAGTFGAYAIDGRTTTGSADIVVSNRTGGDLSEPIVIGFAVVKGATS